MSKPLYAPNLHTAAAGLRRDVEGLKTRPGKHGPWHYVGAAGEPPFLNGWANAAATVAIPNPVPLRFRFKIAGGIEIQGDVAGGTTALPVFNLPAAYRQDKDLPVAGHDEFGGYMPSRLYTNGDFVRGTP